MTPNDVVWVAMMCGDDPGVLGVYGTLDAARRCNAAPDIDDWREDRHGQWWNGVNGWRGVTIVRWTVQR